MRGAASRVYPVPVSTYRVQLTPDFGFAQVAELAGYLRDLGVSHVYLSPILQADPGSRHGYDVIDHSRIRAEFGGDKGVCERWSASWPTHGLGIVVDLVPNHMTIPVRSRATRSSGRCCGTGRDSPYARWFDIDWDGRQAERCRCSGDDAEPGGRRRRCCATTTTSSRYPGSTTGWSTGARGPATGGSSTCPR